MKTKNYSPQVKNYGKLILNLIKITKDGCSNK